MPVSDTCSWCCLQKNGWWLCSWYKELFLLISNTLLQWPTIISFSEERQLTFVHQQAVVFCFLLVPLVISEEDHLEAISASLGRLQVLAVPFWCHADCAVVPVIRALTWFSFNECLSEKMCNSHKYITKEYCVKGNVSCNFICNWPMYTVIPYTALYLWCSLVKV